MSEEVAFIDGIRQAASDILSEGSDELHSSVQELMEMVVIVTVRTPFPEAEDGFFFGQPTNEPWVSLYSYYTGAVLPVTVLVLALAITLILFTGIFGTFLSGYERSRSKRRLVVAFLFVLAWWPIGSFVLRFVDALAVSIAPEAGSLVTTLTEPMVVEGMGTVSTSMLVVIEAFVLLFLVILYVLRWVGIYTLMLAMPLAIAFWIVDVGPFAYLSAMIEDLAFKFVPLAFVTVPAAIIYRVADLVFVAFEPVEAFVHPVAPFVFALAFPFLVLVVSFYVFSRTPSIRQMSYPAPSVDRQTVEKGREDAAPVERGVVHKARDYVEDRGTGAHTDTARDRRPTDVSVASSGGVSRPTRNYSSNTPSSRTTTRHEMNRSRRKVSEERWA